jgi:hypothetical protein
MLGWTKIHAVTAFAAPITRLEAAAIKRFQEFDKLCKTCPTTLKPRVETLTEMIVGLSETEREELWLNVAQRLESRQNVGGAKTPKEVLEFQTDSDALRKSIEDTKESKETESTVTESSVSPLTRKADTDSSESKLLRKMSKTRSKIKDTNCKQARIQRLLHQTETLLSNNTNIALDTCDETDSTIYHSIDELKQMNPTELKYQRLKYMAQKSKTDQKIAKYRLQLYGISLELAKAAEQTKK